MKVKQVSKKIARQREIARQKEIARQEEIARQRDLCAVNQQPLNCRF